MMIFIHGQLVISINTSVVKGWSVFMHEKHHFVFNGVGIYKSAYVYSNVVSAPSDTVTGKIVDVQSTHATYINDSRDRAHVNYVLRNPLQKREYGVQRWAKVGAPGLVNLITAVAYLFCLNLPAEFSQPGAATKPISVCNITRKFHEFLVKLA